MAYVNGKDTFGDKTYISITTQDGKLKVYSSENQNDIIFTKKQAMELVEELNKCIQKL